MVENDLLGIALIIVLAIGSQLVASYLRLPAILILLAAGFGAGAVDWVNPDEMFGALYDPLISVAVGVILFQGGLNLHLGDLEGGVRRVVTRLLSAGVLLTWAGGTMAAHFIFDMELSSALLIGAVLVVTGPTVVIPLLDFIRPKDRVRKVLRWEGIVIDPLGAILAVLTYHALTTGAGEHLRQRLFELALSLGCGLGVGALGALAMMWLLSSRLTTGRQDATATLMVVVAALAAGDLLRDDTGLIATTFMGVVLANQRRIGTLRIVEFKETLGLLLLGVLFVTLAAEVKMRDVVDLGWEGIAFLLALIVIVRPLSVLVSTLRSNLDWRERAFVGWMAPRGIIAASTASVFATGLSGVDPDAGAKIVPITFSVIVGTVLIYGLTAPLVARAFDLTRGNASSVLFVGAQPWARQMGALLERHGVGVTFWTTRADEAEAVRSEGMAVRDDQLLRDSATDEYEIEETHALVLTGIDPFNSIAAAELAEELGKPNVFQIAEEQSATASQVTSRLRRAWTLWDEHATYSEIQRRFDSGGGLSSQTLDERSCLEIGRSGGVRWDLFVVRPSGELWPLSPDREISAQPNDTLISLV